MMERDGLGHLAAYGSSSFGLLMGGYLLWSETPFHAEASMVTIALALGLLALGTREEKLRFPGWLAMAAYWSLQPVHLYHRDIADVVNAGFAAIAVPFFLYLAYRELRGDGRPLRFAAGMSVIAGGGYFALYYFPLTGDLLRLAVAGIGREVLEASTGTAVSLVQRGSPGTEGYMPILEYGRARIGIILACTGIQSILVFAGGIAVTGAPLWSRLRALLSTAPAIFGLNLFRVSGETWGMDYLMARGWSEMAAYNFLENGVAKVGSLVALVLLAYLVFRMLPSLQDDVLSLLSLPKRGGPIERALGLR